MDRELFTKAGASGFLGMDVPEELGGGGVQDFRYNRSSARRCSGPAAAAPGSASPCTTTSACRTSCTSRTTSRRQRWLPGICSGELITAVAMTEPGIGSDLASMTTTAIRDGDDYVVNGSKTFITNGINADLVITAVKTDPSQRHKGMSLLILERGMEGFERGRNLEKVGLHSQDTAELFFTDVRVPVEQPARRGGRRASSSWCRTSPRSGCRSPSPASPPPGPPSSGRSSTARSAQAFGQPIGSFQNSRFKLAEMQTEVEVGQAFIDQCVTALNAGELTAEEAAMAKWWCTELQGRVIDAGVQLHGGYGYMTEYPIARAYADARITRIYGGTTEIMKEIIGRRLGL